MNSLFIKDFDKVVVSGTHHVVRPVRVVQLLKSDSISFETLGMCVKAVTKVHRGSSDRGLACFSQQHPRALRKSGKDRSAGTTMAIESQDGNTVNSLYCGHCGDLELVSSLARVRNSWSLF